MVLYDCQRMNTIFNPVSFSALFWYVVSESFKQRRFCRNICKMTYFFFRSNLDIFVIERKPDLSYHYKFKSVKFEKILIHNKEEKSPISNGGQQPVRPLPTAAGNHRVAGAVLACLQTNTFA